MKRDSVEHELSDCVLFVCDYCEIITAVVVIVIVVGVTIDNRPTANAHF